MVLLLLSGHPTFSTVSGGPSTADDDDDDDNDDNDDNDDGDDDYW